VKARTVFVAFLSVRDGRHDAFLDWHELDHRPENHGGIDHIFHSERFIAGPDMLAGRRVAGSGPFADPGQYLMTYWSTAEPDQVTHDMAVLREQLSAQGRCHPINWDFTATWRQRMYLAAAYASPRHIASAAAAYLTNHDRLVVTVGRYPDDPTWQQWYADEGLGALFGDTRITAAYTLMPSLGEADEPFVHLHYGLAGADRDDPPVQDAVAAAYSSGPADRPELLFQGSYVAQHAAQPRYYTWPAWGEGVRPSLLTIIMVMIGGWTPSMKRQPPRLLRHRAGRRSA